MNREVRLIALGATPSTRTRDASTQTITKDHNLDPINYSRLYISEIPGELDIQHKRQLFFDDFNVSKYIRQKYREYLQENQEDNDGRKIAKIDRKYHLLDRTLNTKILDMSVAQLRQEFGNLGSNYLGLQARMEYQHKFCKNLSEAETDIRFFHDIKVANTLKIGYKKWKLDNISATDSSTLYIKLNNSSTVQAPVPVPLNQLLIDPSLTTNICKMTYEQISNQYKITSKEVLGLQARIEYGKRYNENSTIRDIDLDFLLAPLIPLCIRVGYRRWLQTHQIIQKADGLYVQILPSSTSKR